jgi:hypothetical protein
MGVATGHVGRRVRRAITIISVLAAIAVVLTTTGVVGRRTSPPPGADSAAAATGPSTSAPDAPADAPAAAVDPGVVAPEPVVRNVSTTEGYGDRLVDAPAAAVAAYQRAATVIDSAAPCNLDWLVLAAIGRLASNHGQGDDLSHRITVKGRIKPALVGRPLNGRGGRSEVSDTDAGDLDGNPRWDAPMGPMGLLPETWSQVAVDADGDGVRNVQDLDDATLGAAVLLCASGKDLTRRKALRKALHTYDATPHFARTVRDLVKEYQAETTAMSVLVTGSLTVPIYLPGDCGCTGVESALARTRWALGIAPVTPEPAAPATPEVPPSTEPEPQPQPDPQPQPEPDPEPSPEQTPDPTPTPTPEPTPTPDPQPPVDDPSADVPASEEAPSEEPSASEPTSEPTPEAGPTS